MGSHIQKAEGQSRPAGDKSQPQVLSKGIPLPGICDVKGADAEIGHHKHMLAKGRKGEGKIASLILPHHLNHCNGQHHGGESVEKASDHIPDHVSLLDILIRSDEKASQ